MRTRFQALVLHLRDLVGWKNPGPQAPLGCGQRTSQHVVGRALLEALKGARGQLDDLPGA
jgi:hypothetical protein